MSHGVRIPPFNLIALNWLFRALFASPAFVICTFFLRAFQSAEEDEYDVSFVTLLTLKVNQHDPLPQTRMSASV